MSKEKEVETKSGEEEVIRLAERQLTDRQMQILKFLLSKAQPMRVHTVYADQDKLARELGMTRQALSVHLKALKELGLIRTGREFVDVTEKAVRLLGGSTNEVIVMAKVEPKERAKVYKEVLSLPIERAVRVTGDYDMVIIARETVLQRILDALSGMEGIKETKTYVVIQTLKE